MTRFVRVASSAIAWTVSGERRGIDSDYVATLKMVEDDLVGDGEERPVGTLSALDAGLLADSSDPFVRADR